MNETETTILTRYSCRSFSDYPISETVLAKLIAALSNSPSAGNLQPWHFYLIKNQKIKNDLSSAALRQNFISQASIVFVICAKPLESAKKYGKRGKNLYCIQDTAAATMSMILMASSYGLGSCWVGAFDTKKVSEILELPNDQIPVAIVPIGVPNEQLQYRTPRKDIGEILTIKE